MEALFFIWKGAEKRRFFPPRLTRAVTFRREIPFLLSLALRTLSLSLTCCVPKERWLGLACPLVDSRLEAAEAASSGESSAGTIPGGAPVGLGLFFR